MYIINSSSQSGLETPIIRYLVLCFRQVYEPDSRLTAYVKSHQTDQGLLKLVATQGSAALSGLCSGADCHGGC